MQPRLAQIGRERFDELACERELEGRIAIESTSDADLSAIDRVLPDVLDTEVVDTRRGGLLDVFRLGDLDQMV
jgi:hypothetical protein